MKQEQYDSYRRWVKSSFLTAAVYQAIAVVLHLLAGILPETSGALLLLLSLEMLFAVGWLLVAVRKNIHTLPTPIPFAGGISMLYLLFRYFRILLMRFGVVAGGDLGLEILLVAEGGFLVMLVVTLMVNRKLKEANVD